MKKLGMVLYIVLLLPASSAFAQSVKILSTNVMSNHITPASLCDVSVVNTGNPGNFIFQAVILSNSGVPLVQVRTDVFALNTGVSVSLMKIVNLQSVEYAHEFNGDYIKTHNSLPPGKYVYCSMLQDISGGLDGFGDEYCIDIEGMIKESLNLVYPYDRDTIYSINPTLSWNSVPFMRQLDKNEYYRIVVCEILKEQQAEEAILINNPNLIIENHKSSQLNYPPRIEKLKRGSHYSWQVHKLHNSDITVSSEVWTFYVDNPQNINQSFVIPKKTLDAGFFYLRDSKFYIKFTEPAENNVLMCSLKGSDLKKSKSDDTDIMVQYLGYNIYEINVERLKLKKGSYTMEIINHLKDKYYVKFYVESKL